MGGSDATLTGGGYLVLGNSSTSENLVLGRNEIMARDARITGHRSALNLNSDGGYVIVSGAETTGDDAGMLGIRTQAPKCALDVASDDNRMARFHGGKVSNQYIEVSNSLNQTENADPAPSRIHIGIGGAQRTSGDGYLYSYSGDLFIGVEDSGAPTLPAVESTDEPTMYIKGMDHGRVGIGTITPETKLHVQAGVLDPPGNTTDIRPVVLFENTYDDPQSDVLELRVNHKHAGGGNDFITFVDNKIDTGARELIGSIAGNQDDDVCARAKIINGQDTSSDPCHSGITFNASSGDYAEWLPKLNPDEQFAGGDIVAMIGGKITKQTAGADMVMAVSEAPIVLGNMPGKADKHLYEKIAFLGQVALKVLGPVQAGDYIVPSGNNDGTGVAESPSTMAPEKWALVVGQAWESSDEPGVKYVNSLVGVSPGSQAVSNVVNLVQSQSERIAAQSERITQLEERLSALERLVTEQKPAAEGGAQ